MANPSVSGYSTALSLYIASQSIAAVTGLYCVNVLSIQEFALYSVSLVLIQGLLSLSDLGLSAAIGFFYRERRVDEKSYKGHIKAILHIRVYLFLLVCLLLLPANQFIANEARGLAGGLIVTGLCVVAGWSMAAAAMFQTILRISGYVAKSLSIEVTGNAIRLALTLLLLTFVGKTALLAIVAVATVAAMQSVLAYRAASVNSLLSDGKVLETKESGGDVVKYMLPVLPGAIYHALQPLIVIWLVSYFGQAQNVAEVGALGRLGQFFALLSFVVSNLMIPRLAAMQGDEEFRLAYWRFMGFLLGVGGSVFVGCATFPDMILRLLGRNYATLGSEVLIVVFTAVLILWGGYAASVARLRGWNRLEPVCTGLQVAGQILLMFVLDFSKTRQALYFGLGSGVLYSFPYFLVNGLGFRRPAWVRTRL